MSLRWFIVNEEKIKLIVHVDFVSHKLTEFIYQFEQDISFFFKSLGFSVCNIILSENGASQVAEW